MVDKTFKKYKVDTSKIPFYGNVRGCGYTKTELLDLEKKWKLNC